MITVLALLAAVFIVCCFPLFERVHSANITNRHALLCSGAIQAPGKPGKLVSSVNKSLGETRNRYNGLRFTLIVIMMCCILCLVFQLCTSYVVFWCMKQFLFIVVLFISIWDNNFKPEKRANCNHSAPGSNLFMTIIKKSWCIIWCELSPSLMYSADLDKLYGTKRGRILTQIVEGDDPRRNPFTAFSASRTILFNIYNLIFTVFMFIITIPLTNARGHEMLVRVLFTLFGSINFILTFIGVPR